MCGLFGVYKLDETYRYDKRKFERALDVLEHRGPDGSDTYFGGKLGLGHRRLSVIGVDNGVQPIVDEQSGVSIVVNGEFYNYIQLKQQLAKEYEFRTESDSEILIPLYLKYGMSCLKYLDGEFAFILYDKNSDRLVAARDRQGIKPLYYHSDSLRIVFASEAKSIFEFGVPAEIDESAVIQMDHSVPDVGRSYFKGIGQVRPGAFINIENNAIREITYSELEYEQASDMEVDFEQACDTYRKLFYQAVESRLVSDVPVGFYLSGGLDSSCIVGAAVRKFAHHGETFTLSFDDQDYDEKGIAAETASFLNLKPTVVHVNEQDIVDNFLSSIYHTESVYINTHGVAKYLLSKAVRESGIKVVLTGEGADEMLLGYPFLRQDLMNGSKQSTHNASDIAKQNAASASLMVANEASGEPAVVAEILGHIPSNIQAAHGRAGLIRRAFYSKLGDDINTSTVYRDAILRLFSNQRRLDDAPWYQSTFLWTNTIFSFYILNILSDRTEMAHSVEGRLPFLDKALVDFTCKLPVEHKIFDMKEKYILRESMRENLTETVYKRSKHPFLAPPSFVNPNGKLVSYFRELIGDTDLTSHYPLYNKEAVLALLSAPQDIDKNHIAGLDTAVTQVASLCGLINNFCVNR